MAKLASDGKVVSSGPGTVGFTTSWRLLRDWLEKQVPHQQDILRRIYRR